MSPHLPLACRAMGPGLAVVLLSIVAFVADQAGTPALVNESSSLPRGLYLKQPGAQPHAGSIVAVAQPAAARTYLGALGMPADIRLIKRVAAASGDTVCRRGRVLHTPGRSVRVLDRDGRGSALSSWNGCRPMGPGEVFLLGDTAASFDSRYFGPVSSDALDGVYRGVLTW